MGRLRLVRRLPVLASIGLTARRTRRRKPVIPSLALPRPAHALADPRTRVPRRRVCPGDRRRRRDAGRGTGRPGTRGLHLRQLHHRLGPGPRFEEGFEAQCGCNVRFVSIEDGVTILSRLRLEGREHRRGPDRRHRHQPDRRGPRPGPAGAARHRGPGRPARRPAHRLGRRGLRALRLGLLRLRLRHRADGRAARQPAESGRGQRCRDPDPGPEHQHAGPRPDALDEERLRRRRRRCLGRLQRSDRHGLQRMVGKPMACSSKARPRWC